MNALVLNSDGKAPRLELTEVATPAPKRKEILLRVAACGICYHDVAVIDGTLRRGVKPNLILGHEVSGIVEAVGSDVAAVAPGDKIVAALTTFCGECPRCAAGREYRCPGAKGFGHALDGGFAEYMCIPEASAIPLPDAIDIVDAALLACPIGVAINAIEDTARLRPGETALVVGAGGGLGAHLAQIAAALGARVLAVTTAPHKLAALDALPGVETILADGALDFAEIVLALTDDNGADVVLNPVGSALFASCVASMAQSGRMVILGEVAGRPARINLAEILFRDAAVIGATGASPRHIRRAIDLAATGAITPIISQRFALADAADAIEQMRAAAPLARLALTPTMC